MNGKLRKINEYYNILYFIISYTYTKRFVQPSEVLIVL